MGNLGNILPFKRSRRAGKQNVRQPQKSWYQAFVSVRPFVLLIALVSIWFIWRGPVPFDAPGPLSSEPEEVRAHFALCSDPGRNRFCVVDGDTFHIGNRRIRVIGFDTAEMDDQCLSEKNQALLSKLILQEWLNDGPFVMTARVGENKDHYGRELRTIWRENSDLSKEYLSDFMRTEGGAREYWGGSRSSWCN